MLTDEEGEVGLTITDEEEGADRSRTGTESERGKERGRTDTKGDHGNGGEQSQEGTGGHSGAVNNGFGEPEIEAGESGSEQETGARSTSEDKTLSEAVTETEQATTSDAETVSDDATISDEESEVREGRKTDGEGRKSEVREIRQEGRQTENWRGATQRNGRGRAKDRCNSKDGAPLHQGGPGSEWERGYTDMTRIGTNTI